jgi:hypothetical protein
MKAILKNLKDQILTRDNKIMYCPYCGAEYSANSGDYFMINNPNYKFQCCGITMELVTKQTIYKSA